MKRDRFLYLIIIFALLAVYIPDAQAAAAPDYIRLHIIANSDSAQDQAIKLEVRDAIRAYAGELLAQCENADEAYAIIEENQVSILNVAKDQAYRSGMTGEVSLTLGTYEFPERMYGEELVPAGMYRAIRIHLGDSSGGNWWCVVYPNMCLPEDTEPGEPVVFYSSFGRFIANLFGNEEDGGT